jgi:hypothetical protein
MRFLSESFAKAKGARELAESEDMEPYLNLAVALMQGNDPSPELKAIRQLPVERRCVWQVNRKHTTFHVSCYTALVAC